MTEMIKNMILKFFKIIIQTGITIIIATIGISVIMFWLKKRASRIEIEFTEKTDPGGREENQDFCDHWHTDGKLKKYCFALADGLGGHYGGKVAAETAVKSILEHAEKITEDNIENELGNALLKAHYMIQQKGESDRLLEDMKTTCVCLIILGKKVYWSTIGDSRIYIFRKGKILQKSKDDSVVQVLLDMKEITEEDIQKHPDRNRVLKTLGMDEDFKPKIFFEQLERGDHILLCTDGLWEYFLNKELETFFVQNHNIPIEEKINELFHEAIKRAKKTDKKHDNLTAQLIMVK